MQYYYMNPVDVLIDANVLIAALKSNQGASHRLLMQITAGGYRPNVSVPLFVEYESVAKRAGMLSGLEEADINAILDYILSKSRLRRIFSL